MKYQYNPHTRNLNFFLFLSFLLAIMVASCTGPAAPTAWPSRTPKLPPADVPAKPTSTFTQPVPTATQKPAVPLHPPDPNAAILDDSGWLIYATQDEGLMAVNADGGGPNPLYDLYFDVYGLFDLPNGLLGGRNPLIAMRIKRSSEPGLELILINLRDQVVTSIGALIPEEITSDPANQGSFNIDINFAVMEENAVSWSPDGKYLAYVAASSNNSADIYMYNRDSQALSRVTDCGLLAATPTWTPDSQRIIYQTVVLFESAYDSLWIVNRNGSGNRNLLSAEFSGAKATPIGFLNNATLLLKVEGWSQPGLYLLDVNEGTLNSRAVGPVDSVDYDPVSGAFAFIDETGALQFSPAPITYTERVGELSWYGSIIQWMPQLEGFWVFGETGLYLLDLYGYLTKLSDYYAFPSTSYDGDLTCLAGATLVCRDGDGTHTVTDSPYVQVLWEILNNGFFYVDGTSLYYVSTEDYVPVLIDENLVPVEYLPGTLDLKNIGWLFLPG